MFLFGFILAGCSRNLVKNNQNRIIENKGENTNKEKKEIILPKFQDYVVNWIDENGNENDARGDKYEGKIAPIDFTSHPEAPDFETALTEGIKDGPNFAFYYTIVPLICGGGCREIVVVDARNGKVFFPHLASVSGVDFKQYSKLLIINPIENIIDLYGNDSSEWPEGLHTSYYLWEDNEFKLIKEVRVIYNVEDVEKIKRIK